MLDTAAVHWVHAQHDRALESRVSAAQKGARVEIDNIDGKTVGACAGHVTALRAPGLLARPLVSHDAGC